MGRSIWDMPAAAVAAPPTPNPALTREQQQHQALHQQQQKLLLQQQNEVENQKSTTAWGGRPNLVEEQQQHDQHHIPHQQPWSQEVLHHQSLLRQQEQQHPSSQLTGQEYNGPVSSIVHQNSESQEFENHSNEIRPIPAAADSFSPPEPSENDCSEIKDSFNNSVCKTSKDKKDKKGKKEGRKIEKNNQEFSNDGPQNYIPGMEGAIRPEVPITAAKAMEEEQQRAQADALYRLQVKIKSWRFPWEVPIRNWTRNLAPERAQLHRRGDHYLNSL